MMILEGQASLPKKEGSTKPPPNLRFALSSCRCVQDSNIECPKYRGSTYQSILHNEGHVFTGGFSVSVFQPRHNMAKGMSLHCAIPAGQ